MQANVEAIDVLAPNSIMKKDQMETIIVMIKEQSANSSYFG
jgi:hypothetical protein